ncbi:MAG TPA: M48 family metalloprotease [Phycisphaerae bacterium]|nr:M48 family metalloprotease [Phycisphaerae bacterium]
MTRLILAALCASALCAGCSQSLLVAQCPTPVDRDPHAAWTSSHGGLLPGPETAFARRALERVSSQLAGPQLRIFVLRCADPVAYSFPDGSIYISAALIHALSDDQLAAVVAHELGHLLHDKFLTPPAALRGNIQNATGADIESAADALGRELLIANHIPCTALAAALTIIADRSRNSPYEPSLRARAARQRILDAAK